ncbi:armadillo-type protein [Aspergillus crustosus]
MTITLGHSRKGQSNGAANMHPSGAIERSRGTHGSIGSGLGANANWTMSNIWGSNLDDRTALDNISGSSSLLASSESDGWNANRNVPWPSRGRGNGLTTSPVINRAPDRNGPTHSDGSDAASYFKKPTSSGMGPSPGGGQMNYFDAGPDRISPSVDGNVLGNRVLHRNGDGRQINHAGNATGFKTQTGFPSPLEHTRSDELNVMNMSSLPQTLPDAMQQRAVRTSYSHSSHNSASHAPTRPNHLSHHSFHSDKQSYSDYSTTAAEVTANLERLQFSENSNVTSRPPYVSHASLDTSLNRLAYRNATEQGSYQGLPNYDTEVTVSAYPLGYQTGRSPQMTERDIIAAQELAIDGPYCAARPNGNNTDRRFRSGFPQYASENSSAVHRFRLQNQLPAETPYQVPNILAHQPLPASYDYGLQSQAVLANYFSPVAQINAAALASQRSRGSVSSQAIDSPVLHDFRATGKGKKFELKDVYGSVSAFSGDQYGSRFIQQKLETANSDEKEQVFREIQVNLRQLAQDIFGNYVVQKLFEHGNQSQKKAMANEMKTKVFQLSTAPYGCRVVQKALEYVLTDQQASLIKELDGRVLECVDNANGNHVIQKIFERVPPQYTKFVVEAFKGKIEKQATHTYGCRVIQRMLEYCEEGDCRSILDELHACTPKLIEDQYGNYVIQHVIRYGHDADRSSMIAVVKQKLLAYSKHKFASNVVEKSLEHGSEAQRRELIAMLIIETEPHLLDLMGDQYGNYVIQKVIGHLKGADRAALIERIRPLLGRLNKKTSGKQIASIEKLIADLTSVPTPAVPVSNHSSTTPPNSHKSSPQPLRRSVEDRFMEAPPTPPPTDNQPNSTAALSCPDSV